MLLQAWGFCSVFAQSASEGLRLLSECNIDLVILDLVMPEMDGIQFLSQTRELFSHIPFIVLSAHGSVDAIVASIKQGATDFIAKPFNSSDLSASITKSLNAGNTAGPATGLSSGTYSFQQIVSRSPKMCSVLQMAEQVVSYPQTTVALYGESGVGKEVLARAIHAGSGKADHRFVAVNCAGIPATLLESELFGHVRGAFTGADKDREGMFGLARQGTILLDEIGDMPLELQVKLLRVIEDRSYLPVGSNRSVKANFRIIVATHHDLRHLVQQGRFRSDLFHRVNAFPITIPPLRERKEEIPLLVNKFLGYLRKEMGKPLPGISKRGMDVMLGYDWPGNIRELKNSLERAAIMVDNELIGPSHLAFLNAGHPVGRGERRKLRLSGGNDQPFELHITLEPDEFSLQAIINKALHITLTRCNNNKSLAAQLLKTDRRVFYRTK
ncbi:sigma-54-dependent transcriptional regulator [Geomonas oryzisoli]|uniref:sigma-54-dependent transcriptional regulator n=1 Tax=Geomonas oryzisoli TaxID=2847992 RepID=UPI001EF0F426|nr:sigma-54 dependent transcriptional regulator [Geomonas oryzisoli]